MCKNDLKKLILLKIIIKQNYLKLFFLLSLVLLTLYHINNKKKIIVKIIIYILYASTRWDCYDNDSFCHAIECFLTLRMTVRKSHICVEVVGIPMAIPDPKPIHENSRQFGW